MLRLILLFSAICLAFAYPDQFDKRQYLKTIYEWKYIDFLWPSEAIKNKYIQSGDYDFKKIAPIDVDRATDGRTFVTLIRTKGVPATVNVVTNYVGPSGPLLSPYPSWAWYDNTNCKGILNVYRVAIDKCNRIWILDTGSIDGKNICPAKLLTFDLGTNTLLQSKEIPNHVAQNKQGKGLLITPVIHYSNSDSNCYKPTIFIADVLGHALIVSDNTYFKRLEGPIFEPSDKLTNFEIAGESFHLADGLFGLALTPILSDNSRFLYFRPLASKTIYWAEVSDIINAQNILSLRYYTAVDVLPSQASTMAFSSDGTLFFHLTRQTATGCWNIAKPLNPFHVNIAVQDPERLQFASGLKIVNYRYTEFIITMTNRLQKIYGGTQNFNEINFRISAIPVNVAKAGTTCNYKGYF